MKKIFKNYLSGIAIIIAVLFTLYLSLFYFGMRGEAITNFGISEEPTAETEHVDGSQDSSMVNEFTFYDIPDSLPVPVYKRIEDSINNLKTRIENENKASFKSGMSYGSIGVYAMDTLPTDIKDYAPWKHDTLFKRFADSIQFYNKWILTTKNKDSIAKLKLKIKELQSDYSTLKDKREEEKKQLYYLAISGYRLKNFQTRFYISHGKYKLSYIQWDSTIQSGEHAGKYGRYLSKEIPIRYVEEDKMILIPISKQQYKYLELFLNIFIVVMGFLTAYILVGLPVQILLNISKGKAFTVKNIRLFKQMSVLLFVYSIGSLLMPYILHLLFSSLIPFEFKTPSLVENVINNFYPLLIAIALFLVSKAFQKGYRIQQEQDLTI